MKFQLADLDVEAIKNSILEENLTDYYSNLARKLADEAIETFAERDAKAARIVGVEHKFEETLEHWPYKFVWIADLVSYNPSQIIIDDWKTTKKPLAKKYDFDQWSQRLEDSWQWRIYCYFLRKRFPKHNIKFRYRGISSAEGSPCKELIISSENSYFNPQIAKVEHYLAQMSASLQIWQTQEHWPEYRSSGCFAFGRECPHLKACSTTGNPGALVQIEHLSYSTLEKLILCPERARLGKLDTEGEDGKEAALGRAVHVAMATTYQQIRDLQIANGFNNGKELVI